MALELFNFDLDADSSIVYPKPKIMTLISKDLMVKRGYPDKYITTLIYQFLEESCDESKDQCIKWLMSKKLLEYLSAYQDNPMNYAIEVNPEDPELVLATFNDMVTKLKDILPTGRMDYLEYGSEIQRKGYGKWVKYIPPSVKIPYDYQKKFLNAIVSDMQATYQDAKVSGLATMESYTPNVEAFKRKYNTQGIVDEEYFDSIGYTRAKRINAIKTIDPKYVDGAIMLPEVLNSMAAIALEANRTQDIQPTVEEPLEDDIAFISNLSDYVADVMMCNSQTCNLYYMNSMAGAGKTTSALMAAKAISIFKKRKEDKCKRHFEMVFVINSATVAEETYSTASTIGLKASIIRTAKDKSIEVISNSMTGVQRADKPGFKWAERDIFIMPSRYLPVYMNYKYPDAMDITNPNSYYGNPHAYVVIDEYASHIGDREAVDVSNFDINKLTIKYGSEVCAVQNAPSITCLFGMTLPYMTGVINNIKAVVKDREVNPVHIDQGNLHVACNTYDTTGREVSLVSYLGCDSIGNYLSAAKEQGAYLRNISFNTVCSLIREIDKAYSEFRKFKKDNPSIVEDYLEADIDEAYKLQDKYPVLSYLRLNLICNWLKQQIPSNAHDVSLLGLNLYKVLHAMAMYWSTKGMVTVTDNADTYKTPLCTLQERVKELKYKLPPYFNNIPSSNVPLCASPEFIERFGLNAPVKEEQSIFNVKHEGAIIFCTKPLVTAEYYAPRLKEYMSRYAKEVDRIKAAMAKYNNDIKHIDGTYTGNARKERIAQLDEDLNKALKYADIDYLGRIETIYYKEYKMILLKEEDDNNVISAKLKLIEANPGLTIVSDRTGAYGMNLRGYTRCIIMPDFMLDYSTKTGQQAMSRVGRPGLSNEAKVYAHSLFYILLGIDMSVVNSAVLQLMYESCKKVSNINDLRSVAGMYDINMLEGVTITKIIDALSNIYNTDLAYLSRVIGNPFNLDMDMHSFVCEYLRRLIYTKDNANHKIYSDFYSTGNSLTDCMGNKAISASVSSIKNILGQTSEGVRYTRKEILIRRSKVK